ncbi:MAG: HK97 family phage prohead protease [Acidobacteriales bacterium]|nr:HK97 family phage prohead protease [Terriglobales bacterium]
MTIDYSAIEVRYQSPDGLEIAESADKPAVIAGYAAVFNTLSNDLPLTEGRTFKEVIRPGAFAESLASGADILARFEHTQLLGRTSNGTLRLVEDSRGLRYEVDPPDTTAGRDAVALIKRRDVPYSSFAFTVRKGGDTWRREGSTLVREIASVVLIDVSPVAKPAYAATDVALRSLSLWKDSADIEVRQAARLAMRLALASRR